MILFIPMSAGQIICDGVLKSVAMQSIDVQIVPCVCDGIFASNHDKRDPADKAAKLEGELKSRNLAVQYYNRYYSGEKYVGMCDRDCRQLHKNNFEFCMEYLNFDKECMAVAMPWRDKSDGLHIRNLCFVARGTFFSNYVFNPGSKNHICTAMKADIPGYSYFPAIKKMVEEIL